MVVANACTCTTNVKIWISWNNCAKTGQYKDLKRDITCLTSHPFMTKRRDITVCFCRKLNFPISKRFYIYFLGTARLLSVGSPNWHTQHWWENKDPQCANLQPKLEKFEDIKGLTREAVIRWMTDNTMAKQTLYLSNMHWIF